MPCIDGREHEDEDRWRALLNERTDMLCRVLRRMPDALIALLPEDIRVWWRLHKRKDKEDGRA